MHRVSTSPTANHPPPATHQRAAIDLERFGSSKCDDVCARLVDTFTEQDAAEVRKLMLQCRGIASPALWPASHGQAPDELNDKVGR